MENGKIYLLKMKKFLYISLSFCGSFPQCMPHTHKYRIASIEAFIDSVAIYI